MSITSSSTSIRSGITDLVLRPLDEIGGYPVVVKAPTEGTLSPGITLEESNTVNRAGRTVLDDQRIMEEKPTISLTFPYQTPETLGLRLGRKPAKDMGSRDTWVFANAVVFDEQVVEAALPGEEGFGVSSSPLTLQAARASYLDADGISRPIDIIPYNGVTPPTTPKTMAIGDNLAIALSEDLLQTEIAYAVPNAIAGIVYLTETPYDRFELRLARMTRIQQLAIFHAPAVVLKADEGDISFQESTLQITYSLVPRTGCQLYHYYFLPTKRKC